MAIKSSAWAMGLEFAIGPDRLELIIKKSKLILVPLPIIDLAAHYRF